MIRPSARLAWIFSISVPLSSLLLAGFGSHFFWALVYPGLCIFLFLADAFLIRGLTIKATVTSPPVIPLGEEGLVLVHLDTRSQFIWHPVQVEVALETDGSLKDTLIETAKGLTGPQGLDLALTVKPTHRGKLILTKLWLRRKGTLGLATSVSRFNLDPGYVIDSVNPVKGLHEAALSFFMRETEPGLMKQPFRGEGSEFDSLIEYSQGMDNRFIDWKRSARHHKLLAKDFRQERNHQIVLAFDTGRLMREPVLGLPKLDHYVRAALLMAWVGLQSGDMVGAADFALTFNAFLKPGRGPQYFSRLQRFTAGLEYSFVETNFAASLAELRVRIPHRSLIVFFTEFIDVITAEFMIEALGLLVKKHSVIFVCTPDPLLASLKDKEPGTMLDLAGSVIADSFIRDRNIVLERITRLGIQAVDVPPKAMGTAILNKYLAIKQRGLL
jgi:uncharacterized protein (DUF58 family)